MAGYLRMRANFSLTLIWSSVVGGLPGYTWFQSGLYHFKEFWGHPHVIGESWNVCGIQFSHNVVVAPPPPPLSVVAMA